MASSPANESETASRSSREYIEAALLKIVGTVLNREPGKASLTDDLLTIGASSLKIIHILSLIEEEFSVELTLVEVLEATDLGAIAELIAQRHAEAGRGE